MTKTRVISQSLFEARWAALQARWDLPKDGFQWFPLSDTVAAGLIGVESQPFYAALGADWLRNTLAHHGVREVVRVPEFLELPIEVMSIADATFQYAGFESYWIDQRSGVLDWIVYLSHEESVTLGGPMLVASAQRAWPQWAIHLWNDDPVNYRPLAE